MKGPINTKTRKLPDSLERRLDQAKRTSEVFDVPYLSWWEDWGMILNRAPTRAADFLEYTRIDGKEDHDERRLVALLEDPKTFRSAEAVILIMERAHEASPGKINKVVAQVAEGAIGQLLDGHDYDPACGWAIWNHLVQRHDLATRQDLGTAGTAMHLLVLKMTSIPREHGDWNNAPDTTDGAIDLIHSLVRGGACLETPNQKGTGGKTPLAYACSAVIGGREEGGGYAISALLTCGAKWESILERLPSDTTARSMIESHPAVRAARLGEIADLPSRPTAKPPKI